ncbi:ATP-binding protein [Herbidospora galbida]|uniref:ATP-binding protein n=1 Tax=Herbidospora galbida TaxID=2575442 RepID=A0A4U3M1T2_9ACTN|nr:ATP-binding protein [Herbidospora galbida]
MAAVARLFVRRYLDGRPLAHDAEVVVSEFFSNAIRHSRIPKGGNVRICVIKLERSIRIEVTDPGGEATAPREKRPPPADEHGRGLGIVREMATAWGHEGLGDVYVTSWAGSVHSRRSGPAGAPPSAPSSGRSPWRPAEVGCGRRPRAPDPVARAAAGP